MSVNPGAARGRSADIDEQILDIAAGLFAVHGFDRTSLKQVADAAGYSKTGLLHRFSSKQALMDGVQALVVRKLDELEAATTDAVSAGPISAVSAIIDGALDYPGLVQFLVDDMQGSAANHSADCASEQSELKKRGTAILDVIAGPNPTREQEFRTILALEMICTGVVVGATEEHGIPRDRLTALLLEVVGRVLTD